VTAASATGLGVNAQTGSPTRAAVSGQNTNAGLIAIKIAGSTTTALP
jgi:hypothetical protein